MRQVKSTADIIDEAIQSGALPAHHEFVPEVRRHIEQVIPTEEGLTIKQGDDTIFIGREHFDTLLELIEEHRSMYGD